MKPTSAHMATPPPTPRQGLRRAVADAWALALPFWRAPGQWRARAQLAGVIALTLSAVWLNVRFSDWNNAFYNTLQNHDLGAFWHQLGVFGLLAGVFIVVAVYRQYVQQLLFMRWRTWLTEWLQQGWLRPGVAYSLLGSWVAHRLGQPLVAQTWAEIKQYSAAAAGSLAKLLE